MSFGAFVELAPGVEGLIPLSEMSYTRRVVRSDELVKEGETVSVMIKEVNSETHRISLSLKDAGADPWALVSQKFSVGAIVTGKVERREGYGIFVKLDDGITGLLPKSKAMDKPEFPFEKLKVGDDVTVQIGEIRAQERRISLDVPGDPHADDWKKFTGQGASGASLGTLGGAFGDKLRAAMENKKKK
jgi:small subunit ribosomal protein S1